MSISMAYPDYFLFSSHLTSLCLCCPPLHRLPGEILLLCVGRPTLKHGFEPQWLPFLPWDCFDRSTIWQKYHRLVSCLWNAVRDLSLTVPHWFPFCYIELFYASPFGLVGELAGLSYRFLDATSGCVHCTLTLCVHWPCVWVISSDSSSVPGFSFQCTGHAKCWTKWNAALNAEPVSKVKSQKKSKVKSQHCAFNCEQNGKVYLLMHKHPNFKHPNLNQQCRATLATFVIMHQCIISAKQTGWAYLSERTFLCVFVFAFAWALCVICVIEGSVW